MMRIGHGYDVHRFAENRKLILGGVEIPYEQGLLGHSDADVLAHAIMDALLGAAALGDIGQHHAPDDSGKLRRGRFADKRQGDDGGKAGLHRQTGGHSGARGMPDFN